MPRAQTVLSELIVALGILGKDYVDFTNLKLVQNVSAASINQYKAEFNLRTVNGKTHEMALLHASGLKIREGLLNERQLVSFDVKHVGQDKIISPEQVPIDLVVAPQQLRISVKEDSKIIGNLAPAQVFENIPQLSFVKNRQGENGFQEVAYEAFNSYYKACAANFTGKQHRNVYDYLTHSNNAERKDFASYVAALHATHEPGVLSAYQVLCDQVSYESARRFNAHLSKLLSEAHGATSALASLFKYIFRIDSVEYILAGSSQNAPLAQVNITFEQGMRRYKAKSVVAYAEAKGQPQVKIIFAFADQVTGAQFEIGLDAEIRWSHGKFNGSPECKLLLDRNSRGLPGLRKL